MVQTLDLVEELNMTQESAVQFRTQSRIHIALAVRNLEGSIAFYRTLFAQEPTKVRPHYAKFEVAEPPVNLALNDVVGETGPNNPVAHFGIQVKSTEAVRDFAARLESAALQTVVEENVTCCYAVQNKVWATDPDGNKWEISVVLDDRGAQHHSTSACCPDLPAIVEAVERGDLPAAMSAFQKAGGMSACSCLTPAAT
jgi:catechol 2,3-dioxygenase-like lactoylglutathione lyase family enzyme